MFPTDLDLSAIETQTAQETAETATDTGAETLGKSLLFDYAKKEFVFVDGTNAIPNDTDAIAQWIKLFILTELNKYAIYSDSFGLYLGDLVGYRLPRSYQVAEIERRLTEGILTKCPTVRSVQNWNFDAGHFSFTVKTDKGEELVIYA